MSTVATSWTPTRRPLTADVIRLAADIIDERDLALTGPAHPLYPADGVSIPTAIRMACRATGAHYGHVEAVVSLTMYGYYGDVEPGTTTDAAVAALREAADLWQASDDHAEQVDACARARGEEIRDVGIEAWAREWAAAHAPELLTYVIPGGRVEIRRGRKVRILDWDAFAGLEDRDSVHAALDASIPSA